MFQDNLKKLRSVFSDDVLNVVKQFLIADFEIYIVGGAVRDALLGRPVIDIDMTTNARPEQIEALFPNSLPTGKAFGTITIVTTLHQIQITTYRADGTYSNSRHPDEIQYEKHIHNDLKRRDFTVNALAYNPIIDDLIDDFDGISDLSMKKLRVVGDSETRFSEDTLRLFRACRFAAQLNFELSDETIAVMTSLTKSCILPSKERIHHELTSLIEADYPQNGLRLLLKTGLGKRLFSKFDLIPTVGFSYISKMELTLRWAYLIQYLDIDDAFGQLMFSKKEKAWISNLISYDFDQEKALFTIKDLKLSGNDIKTLGFKGKQIGEIQHFLFNKVIKDMTLNKKDILKSIVEQQFM